MNRIYTRSRSVALALLCFVVAFVSVQTADAQGRGSAKGPKGQKGQTAQAASTPTGKHVLWRVQGDGAVSYIMGSIHILPSNYYPLDPILENVYDSSAALVLELQLDSSMMTEMQMKIFTLGLYTDGRTLKSTLSPKTYKLVKARLTDMGIPMMIAERMKPWIVAMLLQLPNAGEEDESIEPGADMHFSQRAQSDGKPIIGLETLDQQLELFSNMTEKDQEAMLLQALQEKDESGSEFESMAKAWRDGDIKAIERIDADMQKSDSASYRRLLLDRNNAWMPKIEGYLKEGKPYLIVVGAAHLVGPDGVIEMLRRKGYSVEQL